MKLAKIMSSLSACFTYQQPHCLFRYRCWNSDSGLTTWFAAAATRCAEGPKSLKDKMAGQTVSMSGNTVTQGCNTSLFNHTWSRPVEADEARCSILERTDKPRFCNFDEPAVKSFLSFLQ